MKTHRNLMECRLPGAVILLVVSTAVLLGISCATAAPVFYNTGVDANFQPLPGGGSDPHYQLRQAVAGAYVGSTNWSPAIAMQTSIAWPEWLQPADARWIYIADAANLGQDWGTYEYRTTFDLTGYDPSTAVLAGKWAVDQDGSIYLNGNLVTSLLDQNWNNKLNSFNLTSGFVSGTNTLTFRVRHPDGGDGIIVSGASLTAAAVSGLPFLMLADPGVRTNLFGFTISGSNIVVVVVEACTNLAQPTWSPISTNTLTGGLSYYGDPHWTNYPGRFYRLRSP